MAELKTASAINPLCIRIIFKVVALSYEIYISKSYEQIPPWMQWRLVSSQRWSLLYSEAYKMVSNKKWCSISHLSSQVGLYSGVASHRFICISQQMLNDALLRWLFLCYKGSYRISLKKRARRRGTKPSLILVWFQWKWLGEPTNTLILCAKDLIKIGLAVFEIWPGQFKSRGGGAFIQAGAFIWWNTVLSLTQVSSFT